MSEFETITCEVDEGVAWVTLNRPEVYNAFNMAMQQELHTLWTRMRDDDDVRVAVLTGAGDKAFCTGIDRTETLDPDTDVNHKGDRLVGFDRSGYLFDDPGEYIGPKSCGMWKPVIAAVNGMACAGAFYMLGEVEFIIAVDHATFFDPHVSYGMPAVYEPIHMLQKMPFHEIMRLSLLGAHERLSAERAHQIGLVSEVVPADELHERAAWAAAAIAEVPSPVMMGTVRALWEGLELSRSQALGVASTIVRVGSREDLLRWGQERFESGERIVPRTR